MKLFVVVLLLVLFVAAPLQKACAVPFCDMALETGKFLDWLVCMVFAMIVDIGYGDDHGNRYEVG